MASTICKLYHRHIRSLALDFFAMCLLDEQCGGVAHKGPDGRARPAFSKHCRAQAQVFDPHPLPGLG
eukprot:5212803-Pyramimonas_sp.AAC.1